MQKKQKQTSLQNDASKITTTRKQKPNTVTILKGNVNPEVLPTSITRKKINPIESSATERSKACDKCGLRSSNKFARKNSISREVSSKKKMQKEKRTSLLKKTQMSRSFRVQQRMRTKGKIKGNITRTNTPSRTSRMRPGSRTPEVNTGISEGDVQRTEWAISTKVLKVARRSSTKQNKRKPKTRTQSGISPHQDTLVKEPTL